MLTDIVVVKIRNDHFDRICLDFLEGMQEKTTLGECLFVVESS